jgi:hypothetical protein
LLIVLASLSSTRALAADPGGKCAAAKLNAAAKKMTAKLKCHAKAAAKLATVDQECLDKAEAKFVAAFTKAEAKGGCVTNGDAASVEQKIDECVTDLAAMLPPALPPCAGTAAPTCGGACPEGQACTEQTFFGGGAASAARAGTSVPACAH